VTIENEAVVELIAIGIVAVDFHDFGDEAPTGAAFEVHHDVDGITDVGLDGSIWQVHPALQNAAREAGQGLSCGSCVYGGKASRVSGVEKLQEIESLAASDFAEDDPIGSVTKRGLEEFSDGDARKTVLGLPGFETDEIVLRHVDFRGVLYEEDAFVGGNEFPKDIEQRSFS
jgi:hypothetical protein